MRSSISFLVGLLLVVQTAVGFAPLPSTNVVVSSSSSSTSLFFFGQPKDDGSPGDYLCPVSLHLSLLWWISIGVMPCLFQARHDRQDISIPFLTHDWFTSLLSQYSQIYYYFYCFKDCGYVFTKGPAAWAKLSDDYRCPPCGAPKFRFKKVPKGSAKGKVEVKKNWWGK